MPFRCFLWLGGRGGERTLRGGKRTERMGAGLGEDGNGNRGGWERTWRGGKRTKRTEEDGEDFEVGGKRDSERERKQGLGERRNKTLRRTETGLLEGEKRESGIM